MAASCPTCRSSTVSHGIGDNLQCLSCGQLFNSKGEAVERGPDQTTRDANAARMAPRTTNLSGNLADLQRFGAAKAPDPKAEEFVLPPGVTKDDVAGKDSPVNQVSEVVAQASRTDLDPAEERVDTAKALAAQADRDLAAEVAKASKKTSTA